MRFEYSQCSIRSDVQFICNFIPKSAHSYEEGFLVGSIVLHLGMAYFGVFDEVERVILRFRRIVGRTSGLIVTTPCVIL